MEGQMRTFAFHIWQKYQSCYPDVSLCFVLCFELKFARAVYKAKTTFSVTNDVWYLRNFKDSIRLLLTVLSFLVVIDQGRTVRYDLKVTLLVPNKKVRWLFVEDALLLHCHLEQVTVLSVKFLLDLIAFENSALSKDLGIYGRAGTCIVNLIHYNIISCFKFIY